MLRTSVESDHAELDSALVAPAVALPPVQTTASEQATPDALVDPAGHANPTAVAHAEQLARAVAPHTAEKVPAGHSVACGAAAGQ